MLKTSALKALAVGAASLAILAAGGASAQVVFDSDPYFVNVTTMRDIPFRTVVRQQYDYSCGSAALATLLHHHYNRPVTEGQIFKAMYEVGDQEKIRKVGFSLLDMKTYLESQGFKADGYRVSIEQLEKLRTPSITVVQVGTYKHFVVIKGAKDGKILVGDPAQGLVTYSRKEFADMWNGVIFRINNVPPQNVAYNREAEWRPWAVAPLDEPLSDESLAHFTRNWRPIYQVTRVEVRDESPR